MYLEPPRTEDAHDGSADIRTRRRARTDSGRRPVQTGHPYADSKSVNCGRDPGPCLGSRIRNGVRVCHAVRLRSAVALGGEDVGNM